MLDHDSLPSAPHVEAPAATPAPAVAEGDAASPTADPARRALVGAALGLGVLGISFASTAALASASAPPARGPAPAGGSQQQSSGRAEAQPSDRPAGHRSTPPSSRRTPTPTAPAREQTPDTAPAPTSSPAATRSEEAAVTAPSEGGTSAGSQAPARARTPRHAPPHVAAADSPPAVAASRTAPRLATARATQEQVATAVTARARTTALTSAAAVVAGGPRVTTTTVPGGSVSVARDRTRPRVAMPPSSGYAAVAATVSPLKAGIFTSDPVLHLARRATFGPRPSDLSDIRTMGIDGWLTRQLAYETIPDTAADAAWALFPLAGAGPDAIRAGLPLYSWDAMWMTAQATLARQIFSGRQLYEQVVDVMANHLHVAVPCEGWDVAPSYISEVVRPMAMGRYRDMLIAAMRHPAMLQYLNNDVSSKTMVNENLGRELLELHTVGYGAGYTEAEVVQSAKVLTGRMVANGRFVYRKEYHWTGPLAVMGWSSPNTNAVDGLAVGDSYLTYLATHPSTARNIARKLAVRFVSDQPPAQLVDRMAEAYLAHDTDIRAVVDCLFRSPEFWASTGQKSRRPLEDLVGAARVLDVRPGPGTRSVIENFYWMVRSNGHAPLGWDPPNGYPDIAAAWNNAGNLVNRFTMHRGLVNNWWQGLTATAPLDLVPLRDGMTAGQWVDELSDRLLGQRMTTARRDAVVAVANGIKPTRPAVEASWYSWTLIPLLLDSPYFQLR